MSRARDLSRLTSPTNFTPDGTTGRVGLGSENPTAKLNVAGIVSATAFYGDGSNLEGVASAGLGTAVDDTSEYGGQQIYYTNTVLGIGATLTVNPPDSSNIAYTQYQEISVDAGVDLIIGDGDDLIPDILGISSDVQVPGILAGGGGRVRADNFSDKAGTGAPTFPAGINVSGAATVSGNLTVGGVLTYADVTNIDAIGIITARSNVSIADSIIHTGDTDTSIRFPAAGTFTINTDGSEALRVDSSQRLLLGTSSAPSVNPSDNAFLVVQGQPGAATGGGHLSLQRGEAATAITDGEGLGAIVFAANDGSTFAQITGNADGTAGSGDYPGRLLFKTTSDGASSPTERLRIDSAGNVSITENPATNVSKLFIRANSGANAGKWSDSCIALYNTTGASEYSQMGLGYTLGTWAPSYMGYINTSTSSFGMGALVFGTRNVVTDSQPTERLRIDSAGDVLPGADATQDLGSTSKRWANIYSADLQLSNEGSANDVDGTWGQYTIQEGENDLFLLNRRNGKKYRFMLEEV